MATNLDPMTSAMSLLAGGVRGYAQAKQANNQMQTQMTMHKDSLAIQKLQIESNERLQSEIANMELGLKERGYDIEEDKLDLRENEIDNLKKANDKLYRVQLREVQQRERTAARYWKLF